MGGGVGLEEEERAGESEVDLCRSGFVGCVGTGAVGFNTGGNTGVTTVFSFALRFEPFVLA